MSLGSTSSSNRNASACIEPLVTTTLAGSTPCCSAIQARSGAYPMAVPYAVAPPGSLANARAAASLSPSTSTMSSDGAPRANEIVSAAMPARVASALAPAASAREQVRQQRATGDDEQHHEHQQHPQDPLESARRREP